MFGHRLSVTADLRWNLWIITVFALVAPLASNLYFLLALDPRQIIIKRNIR
jgi:hypothetical protein